jgi:DNA replication protein DnaC
MKTLAEILKPNDDGTISPTNSPTLSSDKRALAQRMQAMAQALGETCPICGGAGYIVPDLPVGDPDFGKAVPCRCREQERLERRLRSLQRIGSLEGLKRLTFETFIPEPTHCSPDQQHNLRRAYETCTHFAQEPEGWLLLTGTYGCGKTHLAAAIANAHLDIGQPVLFVLVPDLLDHLRMTFSPQSEISYDDLFEQLRNSSLLILDDLGSQSSTPWAQEKLFQLLNHRYNARLATVITTNQRLEDLEPRLRSRLLDPNLINHFMVIAPDFRSGKNPIQSDLSSLGLHRDQLFSNFDLKREDLDPEKRLNLKGVFESCQAYARQPFGWLVLSGCNGCGKTHLAAAIANQLVADGLPDIMFIVTPDLLDHLRATFSPQSTISYDRRFDEIKKVPILILDNLETESATPWAKEKLFQLLNYRYTSKLPTIITTSDDVYTMEPWLRSRVFDIRRCRICGITATEYISSRSQGQYQKTPTSFRRGRK